LAVGYPEACYRILPLLVVSGRGLFLVLAAGARRTRGALDAKASDQIFRVTLKENNTMSGELTQPADFVSLYRRAFEQFGVSALWSSKPVPDPTPADALAITHSLRVEGDLQARRLAEQIEQACRAAI
jgi:hypothetical protein